MYACFYVLNKLIYNWKIIRKPVTLFCYDKFIYYSPRARDNQTFFILLLKLKVSLYISPIKLRTILDYEIWVTMDLGENRFLSLLYECLTKEAVFSQSHRDSILIV